MESQEFTLETFEQAIRQQELPVVVDFWVPWSTACLMYKERLELALPLLEGYALMGSVDIDQIPELTDRFSIITIPTTMIFYKEQIVKQYIGIQEPETLLDAVLEMTGKKPVTEDAPTEK